MKAKKGLIILLIVFFSLSVSAQTSFSDIIGSELTVEESLVQFVSTITTFEMENASDVLFYLVGPLVGFYFLIKNFLAMGYEMFEDRIDRGRYRRHDELPNGFGAFALVTSFITVLFLGSLSASVLAFAGLASLVLAALMMAGLLQGIGINGGGGGNQQQKNQQGQQTQVQQNQAQQGAQGQQQTQQGSQQGTNWGNVFGSLGNMLQAGQNAYQNWNQQQQQNTANQLQDSLQYFQKDMIDNSERFFQDFSSIRQLIEDAESESRNSDVDSDKFQTINRRVADLNGILEKYKEKMTEDHAGSGSRNWNSSPEPELKQLHNNTSPSISERSEMIANQFQNITTSSHVPPPDDKLRELMNHHLDDLAAVGHFMATVPYDLGDIANNDQIAQNVVNTAKNMSVMEDMSGRDEVQELQALCSKLDNQDNPKILIEEAIDVAEKDLKIEDTELDFFKDFLKSDGEIMSKLEDIENGLSYYNAPSGGLAGIESQLTTVESNINQAMNWAGGIESQVQQHGKYESDILKKLKSINQKI